MKIAILGSAPSSITLAPFADPSFKIWACSPGTYAQLPRCDGFWELHRWEPGIIGNAASQKPWFSPEYVQWMATRGPGCPIWMYDVVPEIPYSRRLPVEDLSQKYGTYFWSSSVCWMIACAIEDILEQRDAGSTDKDLIALYGVDMAATEEYGYQRAGCQYFLCLAATLGIEIYVPPESDLLRPMPMYGIDESRHWMIKYTARLRELTSRRNHAQATMMQAEKEMHFLNGAIDDMDYHLKTWGGDREGFGTAPEIFAESPVLRQIVIDSLPSPASAPDRVIEVVAKPKANRPKAKTENIRRIR